MAPSIVKIDFNVNDDSKSVQAFVGRMAAVCEGDSIDPLRIDMTKCRYVGPDAAALLGALLLESKQKGRAIDVVWPEGPGALRGFCEHSGLIELAGEAEYANRDFDPQYNVLRLRVTKTAGFRDADPVINLVRAHRHLSPDFEEYLRLCVNEVLQNIEDHARSRVGGVMSARYLKDEVRVAIVDRGEGICTTLRRRYHDTTYENALRRVMQGKFTTLSRENNAGLGINHLKEIVCTLGGNMYIISEESIGWARTSELQSRQLPFRFRGTGVFFTLPMKDDENI